MSFLTIWVIIAGIISYGVSDALLKKNIGPINPILTTTHLKIENKPELVQEFTKAWWGSQYVWGRFIPYSYAIREKISFHGYFNYEENSLN